MSKNFSFEEAYAKLEKMLEQLNQNELPLEKAIELYEEASSLINSCQKKLTAAEKKVEMLIKNRDGEVQTDKEGLPQVEEFEHSKEQLLNREI